VKALRETGKARLKLGRRTEQVTAVELDDDEKLPILRWHADTTFRIEAESDDELRKLAPQYPVFKLGG
jgi:hypothetical protein